METRAHTAASLDDVAKFVRHAAENGGGTLLIGLADGTESVACPPGMARAVLALLASMSGEGPSEISHLPADLTTGQAAEVLGVSRPTVVALVDAGDLPAHRVGTHRRIRTVDAFAYREASRTVRRRSLDELTRLSEEAGLYE